MASIDFFNTFYLMRIEKIRINLSYNSLISFLLRFLLLNALLVVFFYQLFTGNFLKPVLSAISLLVILELFIKFSVEKITPLVSISKNQTDIFDSFTKQALESVFFKKNSSHFLKHLLTFPQVKFFLQKTVLDKKDLQGVAITPEVISKEAFRIAKAAHGKFVTTTDILSAYLLLTESQTNLLFSHKLKEEDVVNINSWARILFEEETPIIFKARFVGVGFGETLVWGWTPETKKYTEDLTFSSVKRKSIIAGREKEYRMLLEAMQKTQDNNVLIVGDVGTGKNNLVESLIYESYESTLPKKLNHRRFLELLVGPFTAGSSGREDLETRLQAIVSEVRHSGNVILYIPEFQNLLGASSYNVDLSGAILPYLKDGKLPIIATMTRGEYKKFFENNPLTQVFTTIYLEEPSPGVSLQMLFQKIEDIEEQNRVTVSYKAVVLATEYADKYDLNARLPGTAVELLTDTANAIHLSGRKDQVVLEDDVLEKVSQKSHTPVGRPQGDEKMLLLNLESEMHKFIIGQDEAVTAISEALRRIRAGITREKPISFLFLGPTGVGKTETAKALARIYFGGEAHIVRVDMSEYGSPESVSRLLKSESDSFLDEVLSHPFSLILLDEFEKANEKVLNLFLQVLDDARMTDEKGRTVSFSDSIIIATSNAGSEFIRENLASHIAISTNMLLDYLQKKAIFTPELLNRFDEIVMFRPLSYSEVYQVVQLLLQELTAKMSNQDVNLNYDSNAIEKISREGYSPEFGARPLRRYIQDNVEEVIAKKLISGEIVRGDSFSIKLDSNSNLTINK